MSFPIEVIEVSKEEIVEAGGKPWAELVALWPDRVITINYGTVEKQSKRESWTPPYRIDPRDANIREALPYVRLDHAWLRKFDGRAYLYVQNW